MVLLCFFMGKERGLRDARRQLDSSRVGSADVESARVRATTVAERRCVGIFTFCMCAYCVVIST
jgi:hypothetical protein